MNAKDLAAAFQRGDRIVLERPDGDAAHSILTDEERLISAALSYYYDHTTGKDDCYVCGKAVKMSGLLSEVGFLENVAPDAASGGTMRPVHQWCSRYKPRFR